MQKREEVDCFFQNLSFAKGADEAERRKEIVRNVNRHDFKRVIE